MLDMLNQRTGIDRNRAGTVLQSTVQALSESAGDEAQDMRAQLPDELAHLGQLGSTPGRSLDEFVARVGELSGVHEPSRARAYAQGGFSVLAESITTGQLHQLVRALPAEFGALAPAVSGLTGHEETLLAQVRDRAGLGTVEQSRELTLAVFTVLGEAASAGQVDKLATALPEELAPYLRSTGEAQPIEAGRFLDEVSRRSTVSSPEQARAHTASVLAVLREWSPTELTDTLGQLPRSVAQLAP